MAPTNIKRVRVFTFVAVGGFLVFFLLPPLRQSESYHHFADDRTVASIPNAFNVLSNLPFLIVGVAGLIFLRKQGGFVNRAERNAWIMFFVGALLTCFGSGYYHWAPSNATLVWDRLPMTLAFMALLAAIIGERISLNAGRFSLWPLIVIGVLNVVWWQQTGNLWPYAGTQYYSIFLIGVLLAAFPPSYTRTYDLLIVTGWYALATIFEAADKPIYTFTNHIVSGHTIKHIVAAMAVFWVLRMLVKRKPSPALSAT
jgi:hypothetical protein